MPLYNVLVPVVALIDADTPEQAGDQMVQRIRDAGLYPYLEPGPPDVFEATNIQLRKDPAQ